ncbi:MAG TPA: tyrosine-type recombinase/integrase [Nitrospiraceae bacterium]|jgi:site-specific recombinase XerD
MPAPRTSIGRQLARINMRAVPSLFLDAGEKASWRFIEFFTANIRNRNTREAYARAVNRFCRWCEKRNLSLAEIKPFFVAAYVEKLGTTHSRPSVKQHLAALRMLFDYLVTGQVMSMNPASSVRGPKHVVRKGKTPVLSAEEARELLDSIDVGTVAGLRDRALIAVMVYSFARVGAVVAMNVEDYFRQRKRWWFRLHEKGGKLHDVPAHHQAMEYVDAYLKGAGFHGEATTPLFRTLDRWGKLGRARLGRRPALAIVKRRAKAAGLPSSICCHTFRATGITAYLLNGGTLENAQMLAAHSSPSTTKLYDRTGDQVSLDEIEKIVI